MCSSTWMSHPHEDPDRVRGSDRDGTGARNFPNKHFGTGVGIRFRGPRRGRGAVPYPAPPRCHPWRSSLGASTHLLQLRLRPPPLTHSSLPHHRPPLRRLPLSLVLPPPRAERGGGGRRGRRGRGGGGRGGRVTPAQALTPALAPLLRGAPWPTFSNPWSERISMWPHQGPRGGLVLRTSRRPWSRVQPPTRRPGLHPLCPARRGREVGSGYLGAVLQHYGADTA
jgi:hypothetical protein